MTMKAFISKRTTRTPFSAPISAPIPSAIASDTGKREPGRAPAPVRPRPRRCRRSAPRVIAASAITDLIERSICPAISVSDSPTAMIPTKVDCSRMLSKMPI